MRRTSRSRARFSAATESDPSFEPVLGAESRPAAEQPASAHTSRASSSAVAARSVRCLVTFLDMALPGMVQTVAVTWWC